MLLLQVRKEPVVYLCKEGLHVPILGFHSDGHIIRPCVVIFALSLNQQKRKRMSKVAVQGVAMTCKLTMYEQTYSFEGC